MEYAGYVEVIQLVKDDELDGEDRQSNPTGYYEYEICADNDDAAVEATKDEFHSLVPIHVLDDFDIKVTVKAV